MILPVRESMKTEAKVTIMELVRVFILIPLSLHRMSNLSSGGVPVPQVYSYWGAPNNPVRAEWTIMPGNLLCDCIKSLTGQQKCRTGADLGQNSFCIAIDGVFAFAGIFSI